MRPAPLFLLIIALALPPAGHAAAQDAPGAEEVVRELVAVPLPSTRLSGRVLQKDGVTPVRGAGLRLTSLIDGTEHAALADEDGRYRVDLPLGRYTLAIERRMAVFVSPSHYIIPWGTPVAMDFLLLPDFEDERPVAAARKGQKGQNGATAPPPSSAPTRLALPDPVPEDERVVGSIVDMAPTARARRQWRWAETLGFIGTALAVGIAAH